MIIFSKAELDTDCLARSEEAIDSCWRHEQMTRTTDRPAGLILCQWLRGAARQRLAGSVVGWLRDVRGVRGEGRAVCVPPKYLSAKSCSVLFSHFLSLTPGDSDLMDSDRLQESVWNPGGP